MSILGGVLLFLAGAMGWSLAEYGLHNWVGHLTRGRTGFSKEHLRHHADPWYFTPTPRKVRTAVPVLALIGAGFCLGLGLWGGLVFTVGFAAAYVAYEIVHRRIHTHAPRGPYSRWARRHHLYHHFSNPRMNHGVTSPLWDLLFGTYRRPQVIRVPERHAMVWLRDPQTGEVAARYRGDYEILRQRRRPSPPEEEFSSDLAAAHEGVPPAV